MGPCFLVGGITVFPRSIRIASLFSDGSEASLGKPTTLVSLPSASELLVG